MFLIRFQILIGAVLCASAPAAVVSSGVQNLAIPSTFDGVYLDFNDLDNPSSFTSTSTVPDVPSVPASWDINLFFGGAAIATSDTLQPVTQTADTNAAVLGLSSGDVVTGAENFPTSYSGSLGHVGTGPQQWENGDTAYIGFRLQPDSFPVDNQPATPIHGWLKVTVRDDGTPGAIEQWAWDPTGAAILVPEPGVMTLTTLALAGLATRRRRKTGPPQ